MYFITKDPLILRSFVSGKSSDLNSPRAMSVSDGIVNVTESLCARSYCFTFPAVTSSR